jgi:hypothetical protein
MFSSSSGGSWSPSPSVAMPLQRQTEHGLFAAGMVRTLWSCPLILALQRGIGAETGVSEAEQCHL